MVLQALARPNAKVRSDAIGTDIAPLNPKQFAAFIKSDDRQGGEARAAVTRQSRFLYRKRGKSGQDENGHAMSPGLPTARNEPPRYRRMRTCRIVERTKPSADDFCRHLGSQTHPAHLLVVGDGREWCTGEFRDVPGQFYS